MAILGEERVEGIELVRNELDANDRAVPTDEHETLPCGLVFRSVGYHGVGLPGVTFDEKSGTIPNEGGRIEPGVYCAGWIKRGPTGVIGTNKKDATETVELLLEDAAAGRLPPKPEATAAGVDTLLAERGVRCRRVRRLVGDRRSRAGGRREIRSATRKALFLGRAARGGGTGSESIVRAS